MDCINISTLNDFIFCPYSIYLHNVYMDTDEMVFHAEPQIRGRISHKTIDNKKYSNCTNDILSLPVYSEKFRLVGKIDLYKQKEKLLIERKYQLKQVFQGQIYQLWAQMFCMQEMGYVIEKLAFYEMSTNKMIPVAVPTENEKQRFLKFLHQFRSFNPSSTSFTINLNKCRHCVYSNLCEKTNIDNVYT
ncbi:MAG: type V CRISPR-associated protein Cas4 [Prevotella sp.]